jgi:hypothetical protein
MLFSQVLMSLGSAAVLTLAIDISPNSRLSDIVLAGQNARSFPDASLPYSVVRRDQTFKSDPITLDTSWQNAILYQHSLYVRHQELALLPLYVKLTNIKTVCSSTDVSTGSQGDVSLKLGVQITCATCYIKGISTATLTVAGSGDLVQILQSYVEAIQGDILNITEDAIGIVGSSLEQDVVEFLNATDAIANEMDNFTLSIRNEMESFLGFDVFSVDSISDEIEQIFSGLATTVNAEIEKDTQILHNFTEGIENVIKGVLSEIQDTIDKHLEFLSTIFDDIADDIDDFVDKVFDSVKNTFDEGLASIKDAFHDNEYALPTVDVDFNQMSASSIPDISLQFQLDAFELYMELDTMLSAGATYTLPLYISETPIGVSLGDDVTAGIVATIDLILDIQAQIDISSGFHLKFDDILTLDIELFAEKVSNIHL